MRINGCMCYMYLPLCGFMFVTGFTKTNPNITTIEFQAKPMYNPNKATYGFSIRGGVKVLSLSTCY